MVASSAHPAMVHTPSRRANRSSTSSPVNTTAALSDMDSHGGLEPQTSQPVTPASHGKTPPASVHRARYRPYALEQRSWTKQQQQQQQDSSGLGSALGWGNVLGSFMSTLAAPIRALFFGTDPDAEASPSSSHAGEPRSVRSVGMESSFMSRDRSGNGPHAGSHSRRNRSALGSPTLLSEDRFLAHGERSLPQTPRSTASLRRPSRPRTAQSRSQHAEGTPQSAGNRPNRSRYPSSVASPRWQDMDPSVQEDSFEQGDEALLDAAAAQSSIQLDPSKFMPAPVTMKRSWNESHGLDGGDLFVNDVSSSPYAPSLRSGLPSVSHANILSPSRVMTTSPFRMGPGRSADAPLTPRGIGTTSPVYRYDAAVSRPVSRGQAIESSPPKQPIKRLRWMDEATEADAYDRMQAAYMKTSQLAAREMIANLQPSPFLADVLDSVQPVKTAPIGVQSILKKAPNSAVTETNGHIQTKEVATNTDETTPSRAPARCGFQSYGLAMDDDEYDALTDYEAPLKGTQDFGLPAEVVTSGTAAQPFKKSTASIGIGQSPEKSFTAPKANCLTTESQSGLSLGPPTTITPPSKVTPPRATSAEEILISPFRPRFTKLNANATIPSPADIHHAPEKSESSVQQADSASNATFSFGVTATTPMESNPFSFGTGSTPQSSGVESVPQTAPQPAPSAAVGFVDMEDDASGSASSQISLTALQPPALPSRGSLPVTAAAPVASFGNGATSDSFGAKSAVSSAEANGSKSSSEPKTEQGNADVTAGGFSFSLATSTSTSDSGKSSNQAPTTFMFGQASTSSVTTTAQDKIQQPPTPFAFGLASASSKPAEPAAPITLSFGQASSTSKPAETTSATTAPAKFPFGQANATSSASESVSSQVPATFGFGQTLASTKPSDIATTPSTFNFGQPSKPTETGPSFSFGSSSTGSQGFNFGTASSAALASTSFTFGSQNGSSTLANTASTAAAPDAQTKEPAQFGSSSPPTTFTFGSASTSALPGSTPFGAAPVTFGQTQPSTQTGSIFSFGAAAPATPQVTSPTASPFSGFQAGPAVANPFGQPQQPPPVGTTFTFGQSISTPASGQPVSPPFAFGAAANASGSSFGATPATASPFAFGQPSVGPTNGQTPSSFPFQANGSNEMMTADAPSTGSAMFNMGSASASSGRKIAQPRSRRRR